MPQPLDFYFDFASPYGYLASSWIDKVAGHYRRDVVWRPIMLGKMFKEVGTAPLLNYPVKGSYAALDIARSARLANMPMKIPNGFPHNTVVAARGFYWLAQTSTANAKSFGRIFFERYFGEGLDVSSADACAKIGNNLGFNSKAFLDAVTQDFWKNYLKIETQKAIDRGVFGSPFFFVDGEPFWGNDRQNQVELWLRQGGW